MDSFPFTTSEQVNDPQNLEHVRAKLNEINFETVRELMKDSLEKDDQETYWRAYAVFGQLVFSQREYMYELLDNMAMVGAKKWHPDLKSIASIR